MFQPQNDLVSWTKRACNDIVGFEFDVSVDVNVVLDETRISENESTDDYKTKYN